MLAGIHYLTLATADAADSIIAALEDRFYGPRKQAGRDHAFVAVPSAGAGAVVAG